MAGSVAAFYVGFYRPDATIAYPYTYDQGQYESPGVHTYGTAACSVPDTGSATRPARPRTW